MFKTRKLAGPVVSIIKLVNVIADSANYNTFLADIFYFGNITLNLILGITTNLWNV